ncbi:MAG: hydrogenase, partial [Eggerthellaceae bacterium]|nr:hydrogenase [Eggerthellaceae bacterium]
PLGCRGPQTRANCGIVLWDDRISWCVRSGAPCIGCCEATPFRPARNWVQVNTPFYTRFRNFRIGDWITTPTFIAVGITIIVAALLVIHGFGMKISGRVPGGAPIEKERVWDKKHPDRAIGKYDLTPVEKQELTIKNCGHIVPVEPDDKKKGGKA